LIKLLITGKMGSGKGFAAARIANRYGATRWTRTELMKRLAHGMVDHSEDPGQILELIFPDPETRSEVLDQLLVYVNHYDAEVGKPRRLYQDITQICQDHDPLCFEVELAKRIESTAKSNFSLIDDVRSRAAFEYFSGLGYRSLRINASEAVRRERMLRRDGYLPSRTSFEHSSEVELDQIEHEFVIDNNSERLDQFYAAIDDVCAELEATLID